MRFSQIKTAVDFSFYEIKEGTDVGWDPNGKPQLRARWRWENIFYFLIGLREQFWQLRYLYDVASIYWSVAGNVRFTTQPWISYSLLWKVRFLQIKIDSLWFFFLWFHGWKYSTIWLCHAAKREWSWKVKKIYISFTMRSFVTVNVSIQVAGQASSQLLLA